jgi:hypothetical protein
VQGNTGAGLELGSRVSPAKDGSERGTTNCKDTGSIGPEGWDDPEGQEGHLGRCLKASVSLVTTRFHRVNLRAFPPSPPPARSMRCVPAGTGLAGRFEGRSFLPLPPSPTRACACRRGRALPPELADRARAALSARAPAH